jgi:hypothetical protein
VCFDKLIYANIVNHYDFGGSGCLHAVKSPNRYFFRDSKSEMQNSHVSVCALCVGLEQDGLSSIHDTAHSAAMLVYTRGCLLCCASRYSQY